MSIVTLDEAKQQLNIDPTYTGDDEELQGYVDGITSAVEDYKREVIEQRTITERLTLRAGSRFRLWEVPVISLTSLESIDGVQTWDVSNFDVESDTGMVEILSGPPPIGRCIAVYEAGYPADEVPANYKRGALVVLQHVWETQRGVGAVPGGIIGSEEGGTRDPWLAYTLPRKALEWLGAPRPVVA